MPLTPRARALLALLLLTMIWSYNWIVMKQVLAWTGPFRFAALRYVLGTLVLFAVLRWRSGPLRFPPALPALVLIGLAQTTAFQALVQWALVDGNAGQTALLAYTMPFWLILLSWLVLHQPPGLRQTASLLLAMAGLFAILTPWQAMPSLGSMVMAITGGLCWAIGALLSKRLFDRGQVDALSLTAWQMAAGSVGLVAIALLVPERSIEWSGEFLAALAYNAVLSSGLAWLLWSYVVQRLPAPVAGLSSLVIPMNGVLLAWLLLGERPDGSEAIGIGLLGGALLMISLRLRSTKAADPDRRYRR